MLIRVQMVLCSRFEKDATNAGCVAACCMEHTDIELPKSIVYSPRTGTLSVLFFQKYSLFAVVLTEGLR